MKRVLIFVFFVVALIIGVVAWAFSRPTPHFLLNAALRHAIALKGATVQGSFQWGDADATGRMTRFGGWASYAGVVDLKDLSSVGASGMLGYSATQAKADFETAHVVLTRDRIAFQDVSLKSEHRETLNRLVATTTQADDWFVAKRDVFFRFLDRGDLNARGNGMRVREALAQMHPQDFLTIVSSTRRVYAGRAYWDMRLVVREDALISGLLSLASAWKNSQPGEEDVLWAKRIAHDAANGYWDVVIDESARDFVSIAGLWRVTDEKGSIVGVNSFSVVFGVGTSGSPAISGRTIDVTERLLPEQKKGSLPSSEERFVMPASASESSVLP